MNDEKRAEFAYHLYRRGNGHAAGAKLLHDAIFTEAEQAGDADPAKVAFNGPLSIGVHYLIGLGLELLLKSAYVSHGGDGSDKSLRAIGHDLRTALERAEAQGFTSEAPHLREIVECLREPHHAHFFRYGWPDEFSMPTPNDIFAAFHVLDSEVHAAVQPDNLSG